MRLATLVGLRWLAVVGQTAGVLFVAWGLGYPLPLVECLSLIALSVVVNLVLILRFELRAALENLDRFRFVLTSGGKQDPLRGRVG